MKKIILLLLGVFILGLGVVSAACTDTDGGIKLNKAGTVKEFLVVAVDVEFNYTNYTDIEITNDTFNDWCSQDIFLREFYCIGGEAESDTYNCTLEYGPNYVCKTTVNGGVCQKKYLAPELEGSTGWIVIALIVLGVVGLGYWLYSRRK